MILQKLIKLMRYIALGERQDHGQVIYQKKKKENGQI